MPKDDGLDIDLIELLRKYGELTGQIYRMRGIGALPRKSPVPIPNRVSSARLDDLLATAKAAVEGIRARRPVRKSKKKN